MNLHFGIALWKLYIYNINMKEKYSKKYLLETGIGLQDVDGLKNSSYFLKESERYIKGEISLDELDDIITSYYENKPDIEDRSDEADKVAIKMMQIISEDSFTFSVGQLLAIHKFLFDGVISHAGKLRTYNFSKREWVLDGASVTYGDYRELQLALQYDFDQEKRFRYSGLSLYEKIEHLAIFVANLWQIHAFEEGNTRTTVAFFIKYLRSLGYDVTNDVFAKNAWYFRNALVRANYRNIDKGIDEDRSFLILFLRSLLNNEKNKLNNRDLHIDAIRQITNNPNELKLIDLIKNNPTITTEEIASQLNVSVRTIKSIIKALTDKKIVARENGKRYGYWKVLK